jgi:hypothetical protein
VEFSEGVISINVADLVIEPMHPAGPDITPSSFDYSSGSASAMFSFTPALASGMYRSFFAAGGVTDDAGNLLADAGEHVFIHVVAGDTLALPLGTLKVNQLAIASTGQLDLADNDLIVNNGSYTTIRTWVLQGAGGATGITSSTSDGSQILALFDNALVGASDWLGLPIGANAIVGKYTYFGDMNLDGQVTGDDYTVVDANLNTTPTVGLEWLSGDANLDGIVTGDDYTVIDANLGLGVGNPLSSAMLRLRRRETLRSIGAGELLEE